MMHRIQVRNPLPAPATQPTQPRRVKGILLPADQRECPPATHPSYNASSGRHGPIMSLVEIMTSPFAFSTESGPRIPHPEVYMDLIAPTTIGGKSWDYIIIDSLDGLDKQLSQPYILFYPLGSQDGSAFAVNANIRTIQGSHFKAHAAWRGLALTWDDHI
ncbi:hypothetical protein MIND_00724900 [Mycena indigotica]|uniref:Uncharacterized protein n=1 Tax=Mycena indigotica TaxID=2126181 RepID=A0A8H6SLM0_9AGAR|nr:uncharacterized protein MIND_00724900 [Mycena indigotica]KAF7301594.1 hypothetical protein MIND_00724900 [Mycena indigotica]